MTKAHALLAGSGVGTPAVRTFLDLDSTTDGGALARFLEIAARLKWARHQFGVFKGEHREINLRFEKRGGRGS